MTKPIDRKEEKSIDQIKFKEFLSKRESIVDKAIAHTILERKYTTPDKKEYMLKFSPPFLNHMQGMAEDMNLSQSELYEKIILDFKFRLHVVGSYLALRRIAQKKMSSLPRYFRRRLERRHGAEVPLDITEEDVSNEEQSFLRRIANKKTDEEFDELFNIAYLVADGCARTKPKIS